MFIQLSYFVSFTVQSLRNTAILEQSLFGLKRTLSLWSRALVPHVSSDLPFLELSDPYQVIGDVIFELLVVNEHSVELTAKLFDDGVQVSRSQFFRVVELNDIV